MSARSEKWGVVSTLRGDARDILSFAAHHLEAGAHRLYLYLDAPCPEAWQFLKPHPKIRVTNCDADYWQKRNNRRPVKHQVRQTVNATLAYHRQADGDVDWLAHIDLDEFLHPDIPMADLLAGLPPGCQSLRIRPAEGLAGGDGTAFKAFMPSSTDRAGITQRLYPAWGAEVKCGFLSHIQGKVVARTGQPGLEMRIHNVFCGRDMNPDQAETEQAILCHLHARSWDAWLGHYRYRLAQGSYRAELAPARPRAEGGRALHEVLSEIEAADGEAGLRAFFDEICADTPALRARLDAEGLLRICRLGLAASLRKHFPHF